MTNDGFVLIVSDRPDDAQSLARNVALVMDCRVSSPRGSIPAGRVLSVILDLAPRTPLPATGPLARTLAGGMPILYLDRAQDAGSAKRARDLGAAATLPATMSRTAILATLLKVMNAGAGARLTRQAPPKVRAAARAAEAGRIVMGFFDAAGSDGPMSVDEVDAGTEIVVEAIDDAGIRAWLEVLWSHDDHLYQHALSVTGYAAAFAHALHFPKADRLKLAKAALLHDVGKIRTPPAILNKPGPLDPAEMTIMQKHPVIGEELLSREPGFDPDMLDVVRHHHEMLDGSGYPDGLAGTEIKDLVRLVTICDIYSALTERRPYRAPMPGRDAYTFMQGMTGKLDLALLGAFRPVSAEVSEPAKD